MNVVLLKEGSLFTLGEFSGLPLILASFGLDSLNHFLPVVAEYNIKYLKPVKNDMFVEVKLSDEEISTAWDTFKTKGRAKLLLNKELVD